MPLLPKCTGFPTPATATIRNMNWTARLTSFAQTTVRAQEMTTLLRCISFPARARWRAHIVLEESGEPYTPQQVDFTKAEQRTEAYLKINPQGRVPALRLDNGEVLAENTAILPYLGKRFGLWPTDARRRGQGALADRLLRRQRASRRMPTSTGRSVTRRISRRFPASRKPGSRPFTAT